MENLPLWVTGLEPNDLQFIRQFVLASGSLKQMAAAYEVSYPTVRHRLDQVIEKIRLADTKPDDRFIRLVQRLTIEQKIDFDAANQLIAAYRKEKKDG